MDNHDYMRITEQIARCSKDLSTQVGALLIAADGTPGPWGYNGAPRGCHADEPEDPRGQRPEKYHWFEHAERNAIYNAARAGFRTIGCTLVVTHYPCIDCARAIVQAGVTRVVVNAPDAEFSARWMESIERSRRLFDECGISVEILL